MTFENFFGKFTELYFFKEFTYTNTISKLQSTKQEIEVADIIINIDDLMIIHQLKERNPHLDEDTTKLAKWFKNKILDKAVSQMRKSIEFLNKGIELPNQHGDIFNLKIESNKVVHKIILYATHNPIPDAYRKVHYESESIDFTHIIFQKDYSYIIATLITPIEVSEYLKFRKEEIKKDKNNIIYEIDLFKRYISSNPLPDSRFSEDYSNFTNCIEINKNEIERWNVSKIIQDFRDHIISPFPNHHGYYKIITQIAKMKRTELLLFKQMYVHTLKKLSNFEQIFYVISIDRIDCSFIFASAALTINQKNEENLSIFLEGITSLHKFVSKKTKCIGALFTNEEVQSIRKLWYYLEYENSDNDVSEESLNFTPSFVPFSIS